VYKRQADSCKWRAVSRACGDAALSPPIPASAIVAIMPMLLSRKATSALHNVTVWLESTELPLLAVNLTAADEAVSSNTTSAIAAPAVTHPARTSGPRTGLAPSRLLSATYLRPLMTNVTLPLADLADLVRFRQLTGGISRLPCGPRRSQPLPASR